MSDETLVPQAAVAAPDSEATAAPEVADNGVPGEEEATPKTFTQEELDAKIGERLAKERRKWERDQAARAAEQPTQAPEAPDPSRFENVEAYASALKDYAEKLADHKANQKIAERENQKQRNEIETTFEDRVDAFKAKHADFDKVALGDHVRITPAMAEVIKASELGPELAYHLGNNPGEAERIAALSPLVQARELGKIEATLSEKNPVAVKVSSAPEPIKPVGSRGTTPTYSPSDPRSVKVLSDSEWIAARNKQVAQR